MKRRTDLPVKHPQSKIDKAIALLSEEQLRHFYKLCRFNSNYPTIKEFLLECGHEVSIHNISNWWSTNRPRGAEAKAIISMAEEYVGTEGEGLLQMAAGVSASLIGSLQRFLGSEDIECASVEARLSNTVALLRELRQAAAELQRMEILNDRRALVASGSFLLADELGKMFRGTPLEKSIETAVDAALTKINEG